MTRQEWSEDASTGIARSGRLERDALVLVIPELSGQPSRRVALDHDLTLGASSAAEVVLTSPTVSRLHARISVSAQGTWIVDLESTNGTFVNDVRVREAHLTPGARVRLGDLALTVDARTERSKIELWPDDRYGPLIGRSTVMRALFSRIDRIAKRDDTVLVHGETGTGKELVARAIHEASNRADRPLIVVDCGAIPETLFESELFGHARGSFTGADRTTDGALQSAEGGTLFLDEVGELPLSVQPKLLRALETKTVRRVGTSATRPVDIRVIAATHRDLTKMVATGAFREDLWFRLAVLSVELPPLRERREDIPLLAAHMAGGHPLDGAALAEAATQPWLGNVRELRNFVARVAALGPDEALSALRTARPSAEPAAFDPHREPYRAARDRLLDELERSYLVSLLESTKWNVTAVADQMGMNRSHVHRLLNKHGLVR
jgi:two-component system, NtrC family, response regulator GlrR